MPEGEKMNRKEFLSKHQVIRYLFFGIGTTVVGWVVYFGMLLGGKALLGIPTEDTTSSEYLAVYTLAQIVQWVASVLVAFFTNKKWVFTDSTNQRSSLRQLEIFAGGRVLTFVLDYGITYFGAVALSAVLPVFNSVNIFDTTLNINEISAKLVAAVVVIIGNYIFSKALVFTKKKEPSDE